MTDRAAISGRPLRLVSDASVADPRDLPSGAEAEAVDASTEAVDAPTGPLAASEPLCLQCGHPGERGCLCLHPECPCESCEEFRELPPDRSGKTTRAFERVALRALAAARRCMERDQREDAR